MKIAAHIVIDQLGNVHRPAYIDTDSFSIHKMENGVQELAQMKFYSGVICPALPNICKTIANTPIESIPQNMQAYAMLINGKADYNEWEWLKDIQVHQPSMTLPEIIKLICSSFPTILKLDIKAESNKEIYLISNIDYQTLRLNHNSAIRRVF